MRRAWWVFWSLLAMGIAYHTPWYVHDSAGFTMHAYDLAEWTSLHPAVRSSSPALLTSFWLRIPLWALFTALALVANGFDDPRWRGAVRVGALLLALRFMPPQAFFTGGASDDPNYRQMALLALLSAVSVAGALAISLANRRVQAALLATVLVVGLLAGWWGLSRARELFDNFAIDVQLGAGIVAYTAFGVLALLVLVLSPANHPGHAGVSRRMRATDHPA